MKRNTSKNPHIKKLLRKADVLPQRVTNSAGERVWMVKGKEYKTPSEIASEYLKKD